MAAAQPELGSPGRQALRMFLRNRAAVFGLVLLSGIVLMTLFGSFFYDQDPTRIIARPSRAPARTGLLRSAPTISAVTCLPALSMVDPPVSPLRSSPCFSSS